jgi:hypothetical protein
MENTFGMLLWVWLLLGPTLIIVLEPTINKRL